MLRPGITLLRRCSLTIARSNSFINIGVICLEKVISTLVKGQEWFILAPAFNLLGICGLFLRIKHTWNDFSDCVEDFSGLSNGDEILVDDVIGQNACQD